MQGDTLRKLRLQRGITQAELGREAGVSGQTINNIERGRSRGTAENVAKLAAALDVTMEELMGVDTPKVPAPLLSLNEAQRRLVVKMLGLRGELPLLKDLRELAQFKQVVQDAGLDPESEAFRRWYREADFDEVRGELLPEGARLEEQAVGLK